MLVLSEYARNQLRDTFADVRQCVIFYFMPYIYCKGALTAESRHAAMLDTCSGRPPPLAGRPPLSAKRASHFVTHSRDQSRHRYISTLTIPISSEYPQPITVSIKVPANLYMFLEGPKIKIK